MATELKIPKAVIFDWDNTFGTQRFMGHLPATPENTWKEYKKFKKEQGK